MASGGTPQVTARIQNIMASPVRGNRHYRVIDRRIVPGPESVLDDRTACQQLVGQGADLDDLALDLIEDYEDAVVNDETRLPFKAWVRMRSFLAERTVPDRSKMVVDVRASGMRFIRQIKAPVPAGLSRHDQLAKQTADADFNRRQSRMVKNGPDACGIAPGDGGSWRMVIITGSFKSRGQKATTWGEAVLLDTSSEGRVTTRTVWSNMLNRKVSVPAQAIQKIGV